MLKERSKVQSLGWWFCSDTFFFRSENSWKNVFFPKRWTNGFGLMRCWTNGFGVRGSWIGSFSALEVGGRQGAREGRFFDSMMPGPGTGGQGAGACWVQGMKKAGVPGPCLVAHKPQLSALLCCPTRCSREKASRSSQIGKRPRWNFPRGRPCLGMATGTNPSDITNPNPHLPG